MRPSSHWRRRALLFLVSQCITLFGSPLVQMSIVWYVILETSSGAWVAAFTARSCPLPWPGSTPESGTTHRDTTGSQTKFCTVRTPMQPNTISTAIPPLSFHVPSRVQSG